MRRAPRIERGNESFTATSDVCPTLAGQWELNPFLRVSIVPSELSPHIEPPIFPANGGSLL